MSSTTTAKAESNGVAAINKHVPAQREHGRARLREEECYHLTALIKNCLEEAEHLVRKVNGKAFNRTIDHDGSKGTVALDPAENHQILDEARTCAQQAVSYLFQAANVLQDQPAYQDDESSPF